jgi:hypothetical protein
LLQFIVNHTPLACQDVVSVANAITLGSSCHGMIVLPSACFVVETIMISCLMQVC